MKRFRFPLEAALRLRRRKVEAAEAALAEIEARRTAALRKAVELETQSAAVRESIGNRGALRGSDLRLADGASQGLLLQARFSRETARRLDRDAAAARKALVQARREVETLERLRERALQEWRQAAGREEEALAAELFLARFAKRDNQDQ
jgi:flagellar export protein FliJ